MVVSGNLTATSYIFFAEFKFFCFLKWNIPKHTKAYTLPTNLRTEVLICISSKGSSDASSNVYFCNLPRQSNLSSPQCYKRNAVLKRQLSTNDWSKDKFIGMSNQPFDSCLVMRTLTSKKLNVLSSLSSQPFPRIWKFFNLKTLINGSSAYEPSLAGKQLAAADCKMTAGPS